MSTAALIISVVALALSLATITMQGRTIRRGRPTAQIPLIWDARTGHHKPDLPYLPHWSCAECKATAGRSHAHWCTIGQGVFTTPPNPAITTWIDETLNFKLEPWQRSFIDRWMTKHDGATSTEPKTWSMPHPGSPDAGHDS